jgi:hypothetical protein
MEEDSMPPTAVTASGWEEGRGSKTERREPVNWREVNEKKMQNAEMEMTLWYGWAVKVDDKVMGRAGSMTCAFRVRK